jgi:hypothetical protein
VIRPETSPREKYHAVVIENMSAVAPLPVPKSSAIEVKKAPKLYATPNTVKVARNVAPTTTHACAESTAVSAGGATWAAPGGAAVVPGTGAPICVMTRRAIRTRPSPVRRS